MISRVAFVGQTPLRTFITMAYFESHRRALCGYYLASALGWYR